MWTKDLNPKVIYLLLAICYFGIMDWIIPAIQPIFADPVVGGNECKILVWIIIAGIAPLALNADRD
jgi:hypothetical protein